MPEFIRVEKMLNERLRECERGTILCPCGAEVLCYSFTNTCDNCGREYNMSGQMLAPRSQWGGDGTPYDEEEGLPGMSDDDFQMREWEG